MFKRQNADRLIVMSKGGLGKTSLLKEIMGCRDGYVFINTHSTPLKTYLTLYERRDAPVVFDDLDAVLRNKIFFSMLKSLADTSPIKELHYNTTSALLANAPESFTTTSNVCLLLNEFDVHNHTLEPLLSRGFFIEFKPSRKEILKKIKSIAESQNMPDTIKYVYEYFEQHYEKIQSLSLRTFIKAVQLYTDNPKAWKERFLKEVGFDDKIIQYLLLKEWYKTDEERIQHYKWSRATYYRIKKEQEQED